jgi:SET domain-containing protein
VKEKRTYRRQRPRFAVRSSSIHGKGVFALRKIRKGERIMEYKGERISHAAADRRYAVTDGDDDVHTMLFTVDKKMVIDATRNGNSARWINHSCSPNCETETDRGRVYIDALRDIRRGEELTYDYGLYLDERHTPAMKAAYSCSCGSRRCRGTLLGKKP